jgi:hypothetical protein
MKHLEPGGDAARPRAVYGTHHLDITITMTQRAGFDGARGKQESGSNAPSKNKENMEETLQ